MDRNLRDAFRYLKTEDGARELKSTFEDDPVARRQLALVLLTKEDLLTVFPMVEWSRKELSDIFTKLNQMQHGRVVDRTQDPRLKRRPEELNDQTLRELLRRYRFRTTLPKGEAPTDQEAYLLRQEARARWPNETFTDPHHEARMREWRRRFEDQR